MHLFSPTITLIIYIIQAQLYNTKFIDVNMAFTSIAIISIIYMPANYLFVFMAKAATVVTAFDRIQTYLLSPDRKDMREILDKQYINDGSGTTDDSLDGIVVNIDHATIRPASTADPVLRNISTALKKGDIVVVSGAVGTGKTTLAKTLLGDLPPDSGIIQTAYRSVAYCSQTAWLINGTIKETICGLSDDNEALDKEWYKRVIYACDLEEDFDQMPDGDQTIIGSRGITLSGGQKQRVVSISIYACIIFYLLLTLNMIQALARAVYARRSLIILDDVLSALDIITEQHIIDNLIGPNGLFKELGTTVILITHTSKVIPDVSPCQIY